MRNRWRSNENEQSEKAIVSGACNREKVSILSLVWFALGIAVVLFPSPHAMAQGPREAPALEGAAADSAKPMPLPARSYKEPTKNLLALGLGGASWESLGNKEFGTTSTVTRPGHISSGGLVIEAAYHQRIVQWERGNLYLGAEFGAFLFENKESENTPSTGQPRKGELDARIWYAGPSIKFMMGEGRFKYFLGAGGGYYQFDLEESDEIPRPACTNFGPCFETKR
ncbi:MAG TPA: hypothetical protein VGQ08_07250 [Nitrospiraceae bacterium]|jgi:hypothetical protein|nr:hypothetical protein [Nitrospiraceae bacterium]